MSSNDNVPKPGDIVYYWQRSPTKRDPNRHVMRYAVFLRFVPTYKALVHKWDGKALSKPTRIDRRGCNPCSLRSQSVIDLRKAWAAEMALLDAALRPL